MHTLRLMLRMLWRDWRAGELTVLALALTVAVASLTSVGFLTDRIGQALVLESHQLLGGDLLLTADHPLGTDLRAEAARHGLRLTDSASFPSMAGADVDDGTAASADANNHPAIQLAEIKAVAPGYPLRGALRNAPALHVADTETRGIPARGTVWLDERLATALGVAPGARIRLGNSTLRFAAVLTQEPDRAMSLFGMAPHLLMHVDDLTATGLIQPASRVAYRLHLAGEPAQVEAFSRWVKAHPERGERLEDIGNARPEVRAILDRAQRFLRLAALLAVVLAAIAAGFAADRYLRRHLDACAVMRCLGAHQTRILMIHGGEFALLGLSATLVGCGIGYLAQWGLQEMLSGLFFDGLPPPSWRPWAQGLLIGAVLVAGFTLPPLLRLRRVPALHVLRREWSPIEPLSLGAHASGALALTGLMIWIAGEPRLGGVFIIGFIVAFACYVLLARALLFVVGSGATHCRPGHLSRHTNAALRLGLTHLRRHAGASVLQATALGLGLTAILLLGVTRQGLLENWRGKMPPDAPNHFIINIQPDQAAPLRAYFLAHDLPAPALEPMIRARLVAIDGHRVSPEDFGDERARHLVDREFNLSWSAALPAGNTVSAGRWHGAGAGTTRAAGEFSVEQGLAETLNLAIGNTLTYEIAGERIQGRITSLRKLDWDSLRVNFFVIAPPGMLDGFPASMITSIYLPPQRRDFVGGLVRAFPNLTVIDVAALLQQLQTLLDRIARAVQAIFGFALLAGLIVLIAALQASEDARHHEVALLRALGVRRRQLRDALLAEFAVLGAIAGLLAGLGSATIGWALAHFALHLDYQPAGTLLPLGMVIGIVGFTLAGWFGTAGILRRPALEALRNNT